MKTRKRAIIFKDKVLILETWEFPNSVGNWIWYKSYEIDSCYTTDKSYNACLTKDRVNKLREMIKE